MRTGGLGGAALLVAAEFTTVVSVQEGRAGAVTAAVTGGPHHRWALLPIAALAGALSFAPGGTPRRREVRRAHAGTVARALALGALGLVALAIAVRIDLPASRSAGLIGQAGHRYVAAAASAGPGLYLETLGAVTLLLAAAAPLLWRRPSERADRATGPHRTTDIV